MAAFIVLCITVPVLIGLTYLVRNTKPGKAMRATAQDRDASAMMGINVDRTISFTFALGGALAGAGGVVYMLYVGTSTFQLGFRLGLFAFTAAVLGGIGNLSGAVLGGLILGLVAGYNDGFGDARWTTTIVFSVLILILVFRPSGLLGEHARGPVSTIAATWQSTRSRSWFWPVVILVIAVSYAWWYDIAPFSYVTLDWLGLEPDVAVIIGVYVMLALGLNIVVGYAGLLDLGYVAFFAIGAYTVGWLASGFFNSEGHPPRLDRAGEPRRASTSASGS